MFYDIPRGIQELKKTVDRKNRQRGNGDERRPDYTGGFAWNPWNPRAIVRVGCASRFQQDCTKMNPSGRLAGVSAVTLIVVFRRSSANIQTSSFD